MAILNKDEIVRRLEKGELLIKARKNTNNQFDVEPDSYDLSAGAVVWKEEIKSKKEEIESKKYEIKTAMYKDSCSLEQQPTITVQPGQMVFVVTQEEIKLPLEICGTVYSRNNIALEGILALNAGHVDPGYKGPIVIRLINLKAMPWTLHLGKPIFTITFQTVDYKKGDKLVSGPIYPFDKMLDRVRKTADNSLSNALFDLYADKIDNRLLEHESCVEVKLRNKLTETFLPRNELISCFFKKIWTAIMAIVVVLCTIGAFIFAMMSYFKSP